MGHCSHCKKPTIWLGNRLIYPSTGSAPFPNPDLPEDIKKDYEEARAIVNRSPRGAAALLRLAIQKLCIVLDQSGENLNADIGALVGKGLLRSVQQALDAVRVIGNHAVHPGEINLEDDPDIANTLFALVNRIADQMITAPKEADAAYALLPESIRMKIEERNRKALPPPNGV